MPPPSTRSNSPKPVGMRVTDAVSICVIGCAALETTALAVVRAVRPGAAVRVVDGFGFASRNSSIVPHWPHSGQRPYHFDPVQPHSVHT